MTAFNVQNGTNAGWRVVKPTPEAWVCRCGKAQPKHRNNCPACYGRRSP